MDKEALGHMLQTGEIKPSEYLILLENKWEASSKELEAKILTFRMLLQQATISSAPVGTIAAAWLERYDEHFGIETLRHGTTGKEISTDI